MHSARVDGRRVGLEVGPVVAVKGYLKVPVIVSLAAFLVGLLAEGCAAPGVVEVGVGYGDPVGSWGGGEEGEVDGVGGVSLRGEVAVINLDGCKDFYSISLRGDGSSRSLPRHDCSPQRRLGLHSLVALSRSPSCE